MKCQDVAKDKQRHKKLEIYWCFPLTSGFTWCQINGASKRLSHTSSIYVKYLSKIIYLKKIIEND